MEEFIHLLQSEINEPKFGSWFHLTALAVIIPLAVSLTYLIETSIYRWMEKRKEKVA